MEQTTLDYKREVEAQRIYRTRYNWLCKGRKKVIDLMLERSN